MNPLESNPLDWQWVITALGLVVVGTAAVTWLVCDVAANRRRWRDRAQQAEARATAAEQALTEVRRHLRRRPSPNGQPTVAMSFVVTPRLLAEVERVLAGEAATQVLTVASTRRTRRLHRRMGRRRQ